MEICKQEEILKNIHNWLNGHGRKIEALENKVSTVERTSDRTCAILERLEKTVERIEGVIDKAKTWIIVWLIGSVITPITVGVIIFVATRGGK